MSSERIRIASKHAPPERKKHPTRCFLSASRLTSRIVVFSHLGTLGSENSLLCGVKRCENDYQSFSLSFQIRTGCKQPILIGGWLQKKKKTRYCVSFFFWRRHPDLNRGITVLQTVALPLGYDATYFLSRISLCGSLERITGLEPATSTLARLRSTK